MLIVISRAYQSFPSKRVRGWLNSRYTVLESDLNLDNLPVSRYDLLNFKLSLNRRITRKRRREGETFPILLLPTLFINLLFLSSSFSFFSFEPISDENHFSPRNGNPRMITRANEGIGSVRQTGEWREPSFQHTPCRLIAPRTNRPMDAWTGAINTRETNRTGNPKVATSVTRA